MPSAVLHNPVTGQRLVFLRRTPDLLLMESTLQPGAERPPLHYHPHQDERFTVLAGRLRVELDGEDHVLSAGQSIDVPRGAVHEMTADGDSEARVRWEISPALNAQEMLTTWFALAACGEVDEKGMPSLLQMAAVARRFSGDVRMASPPWPIQRLALGLLGAIARMRGYQSERSYPVRAETRKPLAA